MSLNSYQGRSESAPFLSRVISSSNSRPVRIALRGAGGMLGFRFLRALQSNEPEMVVSHAVLNGDEQSFERFKSVLSFTGRSDALRIFLDADSLRLKKLRVQSDLPLEPFDPSALNDSDIILDAARVSWDDPLEDFFADYSRERPVLHQSGTYPLHSLLALPFPPQPDQRRYRHGDCLMTALAPVLYPFRKDLQSLRLSAVIQRQSPVQGYPTRDHVVGLTKKRVLEVMLERNTSELLGLSEDCVSSDVYEAFGADYYLCNVVLRFLGPVDRNVVLERLRESPRVALLPREIVADTSRMQELLQEHVLYTRGKLAPVLCFTNQADLSIRKGEIHLLLAIDSKQIAVLGNIDAVRTLVRGMDPLASMRETDHRQEVLSSFAW